MTDAIFLAYGQAFDTACHSRLMIALSHVSLPSNTGWIRNFLSNRFQCFYVKNTLSKLLLTSGIAQGSILAPLLFFFLNFMNEPSCDIFSSLGLSTKASVAFRAIHSTSDIISLRKVLPTTSCWGTNCLLFLKGLLYCFPTVFFCLLLKAMLWGATVPRRAALRQRSPLFCSICSWDFLIAYRHRVGRTIVFHLSWRQERDVRGCSLFLS